MNSATAVGAAQYFLRLALAAGFLSAVADRFGLWGPAGAANVAWGAWQPFVDYVAKLNWFAPPQLLPPFSRGRQLWRRWFSVSACSLVGSCDGLRLPLAFFYCLLPLR
jgi:hypothetical protein